MRVAFPSRDFFRGRYSPPQYPQPTFSSQARLFFLDITLCRFYTYPFDASLGRQWNSFRKETAHVTKKEIVKHISEEVGLTQLKTKEIVQKTFEAIIETLIHERRIELRNFGVFEVKQRKARQARNPKTSEPVYVASKLVVTFKPGKEMEERVSQMDPVPEIAGVGTPGYTTPTTTDN